MESEDSNIEKHSHNKNLIALLLVGGLFGLWTLIRKFIPGKVVIKWSYPREYYNGMFSEKSFNGWGVYCISKKKKGKEAILYIGKAYESNFYSRMNDHDKKWVSKLLGDIVVRFGQFKRPYFVDESVVHDVESALIYEHQPIKNLKQTKNYTYSRLRNIYNKGFRGPLEQVVRIKDHK